MMSAVDKELQQCIDRLTTAQKKALLNLLKTFLPKEKAAKKQ
ncbi:MAG: hypothetical protein K0Q79_116 [Flavipsychrobacter sp.]|jgi:hypothetical protein|nr:hypothetical protein [Flavipsychrobacter sp.]